MSKDPYADLGVDKNATADEIKKAYRKLAKECHPDLNPDDAGAEARFKAGSAAYDLLKDPEKRARFDRGEIDASGAETTERQYYRDFADRPENPYQSHQNFEDGGGFSDIFEELFRQRSQGGARQQGAGFSAKGQNRQYALEVPFLDAALGATTRITLPDGGSLNVKIPEGTADGQTIRLRGKGGPGFGGGPAGDALVTLTVRPHDVFRRQDNDILVSLPITIYEAVLGAKVEAPTIDGNVKVTIPKGASSGQTLRLRKRGVMSSRAKTRGDQLIELRIVMPDKPDAELERFMTDWQTKHGYDPRKGMKS